MTYVAVNEDGQEYIYGDVPYRKDGWACYEVVALPKGTIKKLIGRELTWDDEPVEIR